MHKHNFGQTLKIQSAVVTLNILGQCHQNLINSFLSANNVSMQVWCRKIHWFRRQSSEKADFTYHDNEVTLKTRSKSPKSYQLFILPQ